MGVQQRNPVIDSAEFICKNSENVRIVEENIEKASLKILDGFKKQRYSAETWKSHELNPKECGSEAIEWIFVVDALNFCFWSNEGVKRPKKETDAENSKRGYNESESKKKYTVTFEGKRYQGYWTLCACINRALKSGIKITDANYYSKITLQELQQIFMGDEGDQEMEQIQMLEERLRVLHEMGTVLVEKYGGKFSNVVIEAGGSAQKLLELILMDFGSCFRDACEYKGRTVMFNKRAQILVADIWASGNLGLRKQKPGEESEVEGNAGDDIEYITMFADYRVPQILVGLGVMEYSERLLQRLNDKITMENGDEMEVEIRGNSIMAVEKIKDWINKNVDIHSLTLATNPVYVDENVKGGKINSVLIDFYLWDYAKSHSNELKDIPIHLTKSIYY